MVVDVPTPPDYVLISPPEPPEQLLLILSAQVFGAPGLVFAICNVVKTV